MSREPAIVTEGRIVETLDGRAYRASLPNGKVVFAHAPRSAADMAPLEPGAPVQLELNPYDFSRARIRTTENSPTDEDNECQP